MQNEEYQSKYTGPEIDELLTKAQDMDPSSYATNASVSHDIDTVRTNVTNNLNTKANITLNNLTADAEQVIRGMIPATDLSDLAKKNASNIDAYDWLTKLGLEFHTRSTTINIYNDVAYFDGDSVWEINLEANHFIQVEYHLPFSITTHFGGFTTHIDGQLMGYSAGSVRQIMPGLFAKTVAPGTHTVRVGVFTDRANLIMPAYYYGSITITYV